METDIDLHQNMRLLDDIVTDSLVSPNTLGHGNHLANGNIHISLHSDTTSQLICSTPYNTLSLSNFIGPSRCM